MPNMRLTSFLLFQSTLPVGGATVARYVDKKAVRISIHAPRGGSDPAKHGSSGHSSAFQSTLPVGGATPA